MPLGQGSAFDSVASYHVPAIDCIELVAVSPTCAHVSKDTREPRGHPTGVYGRSHAGLDGWAQTCASRAQSVATDQDNCHFGTRTNNGARSSERRAFLCKTLLPVSN